MDTLKLRKEDLRYATGLYLGSRSELCLPLTERNVREFCFFRKSEGCPDANNGGCLKCMATSGADGYVCYPYDSVSFPMRSKDGTKEIDVPLRSVYFGHSQQGLGLSDHRVSFVFEVDQIKLFAQTKRILRTKEAAEFIERTSEYTNHRWFGSGKTQDMLLTDACYLLTACCNDDNTVAWYAYDNFVSLKSQEKGTKYWRMENFNLNIDGKFDYALADVMILLYGMVDLYGYPMSTERWFPFNDYESVHTEIVNDKLTNHPDDYPLIGMYEDMEALMSYEDVPTRETLATLLRIILGNYTYGHIQLGALSCHCGIAFIRQWAERLGMNLDRTVDVIMENYLDTKI